MSRTTLAIDMLNILSTNSIVSRSELAQRLEVKLRYVSLLREELITAGYNIETVYGKNGGYRLNTSNIVPIIDNEFHKDLSFLLDYINERDIFLYKDRFINSLEKLMSSYSSYDKNPLKYKCIEKNKYRKNSVIKFNKNLSILMDSVINKNQVNIIYFDEYLDKKSVIFQVNHILEYECRYLVVGLMKYEKRWKTIKIPLESIFDIKELPNQYINLDIEKIKYGRKRRYVIIDFSKLSKELQLNGIGYHYDYISKDKKIVKFWVEDIFSLHTLLNKIEEGYQIIEHNLF